MGARQTRSQLRRHVARRVGEHHTRQQVEARLINEDGRVPLALRFFSTLARLPRAVPRRAGRRAPQASAASSARLSVAARRGLCGTRPRTRTG